MSGGSRQKWSTHMLNKISKEIWGHSSWRRTIVSWYLLAHLYLWLLPLHNSDKCLMFLTPCAMFCVVLSLLPSFCVFSSFFFACKKNFKTFFSAILLGFFCYKIVIEKPLGKNPQCCVFQRTNDPKKLL